MSIFKKDYKPGGSMRDIRIHIYEFMALVDTGIQKFDDTTEAGKIFRDMKSGEMLLVQASAGNMYEFERKLDPALWGAAMQKFGDDLSSLREALIHIVDEVGNELSDMTARPVEEEKTEEKKEESGDWRKALKADMEATYAAKEAEEAEEEEREARATRKQEEAQELWALTKNLDKEFTQMKSLGEAWFDVHGTKGGCLSFAACLVLVPTIAATAGAYFL